MCDVPICDEGHCGAKGVCVEPNVCTCPELTSRVSHNYSSRAFNLSTAQLLDLQTHFDAYFFQARFKNDLEFRIQ